MKFKKGQIIAEKYEIKNFIEETSFCSIYSAVDKISSNFVSLYIYNAANIAKDDLDEENNFKEVEFLGLGVDGFARLLGFGDFNFSNERYRYIATEFIVGESVTDRMKRKGPLTQVEATIICLKLAEIADNLHNLDKSVLLNALSLDNIMFDMSEESEKIKLRNLINVRYFEDEFKYKYVDGVIPNYLAPECFNDVFTAKSDQFNIASIMYHMISGLPPWFSEPQSYKINLESIDILENSRFNTLNFSDSFDEHIKAVISKALNHNPEERFISLQNLITYLNRDTILSSHGAGTTPKRKLNPKKTGNGFADVGGMDELKNLLISKIIKPLKDPEKAKKHGVTVPNGMLLYGPPGCGKTYIAKKFAEEAGYNFYFVKASDVSSIYVSGGEQKIGELFLQAEKNTPAIICFDEIDAVMPSRKSGSGGNYGNQSLNSRVNEYLSQIDNCSQRGIFVIGTTNRKQLIDKAILRTGRLDFKIEVSLPDFEARKKIFEIHLKNKYVEFNIDYDKLSNLCHGYTSSDIEFIVRESANKSYHLELRISNKIIEDIISQSTSVPSLSKKDIDKYSTKKPEDSSNSLGFRRNRD